MSWLADVGWPVVSAVTDAAAASVECFVPGLVAGNNTEFWIEANRMSLSKNSELGT